MFGINTVDLGYVQPIFLAEDNSLGGYRSVLYMYRLLFTQICDCLFLSVGLDLCRCMNDDDSRLQSCKKQADNKGVLCSLLLRIAQSMILFTQNRPLKRPLAGRW